MLVVAGRFSFDITRVGRPNIGKIVAPGMKPLRLLISQSRPGKMFESNY